MEVRLLGSIVVVDDVGRLRPIASGRLRALLCAIALQRGRPLAHSQLIDLLWGAHPPLSARTTLHGYVHRLRAAAGAVVETHPAGYSLAEDVVVDEQTLERLLDEATAVLDESPRRAARLALDALRLSRGTPLADLVEHYAFAAVAAARLEDRQIAAAEVLAEARLRTGQAASASEDLAALVEVHPYRERLWALLIRALYADGRARDALAAFQRSRRTLADDLGLDPSPILVEAERMVLTHSADPGLLPRRRESLSPALASIEYVRNHALQLAYRIVGRGPNVVIVSGTASFLLPLADPWVRRLAGAATVLAFDPRGIGRSDPIIGTCGLDERVADLLAAMGAAGIERAVLIAVNDGGPIALAAAARHPDSIDGLVMFHTWDRPPFTLDDVKFAANQRHYEATWGAGCTLGMIDPELAAQPDVQRAIIEMETLVASPSQALAVNRAAASVDARPLIPLVRCPVVVLHDEKNNTLPIAMAAKLAARLGAPLERLPGRNHNFLLDDPGPSVDAIIRFVASCGP